MNRLVRNPEGDSGAVAIIVTVCLILMFLLVSLAIDLGFARADVRNNQTMSDFASLAAVNEMKKKGTYEEACEAAVDYVFANAKELVSGSAEHTTARNHCAGFLSGGCDPAVSESTPPIPAGPYTITVTSPVLNNDPTMTVEGQQVNKDIDGEPCDRIKVSVVRQRDYIFGPVAGNISGNPAADAVGVYFEVREPDEIASLIVLEQTACNALTTNGSNAGFMVTNNVIGGVTYPGRIATDSDGAGGSGSNACTNNRYTIDQQQGTICAQGDVGSHALGVGNQATSHPGTGTTSCLPTSLGGAGAAGLGVQVIPRPNRYGRSSVDWLVNCQSSYPAYNTSGDQRYPFYGDTAACPMTYGSPAAPLPAFVDTLHDALQSGPLAGFHVINNCNGAVANPPNQTKIHVTCAPGAQTNSIVFTDVTHVVFDHPVPQQVTNLTVTNSGDEGAVVYFRGEGIRRTSSGSTTVLDNVFVYVNTATGLGVETNGGNVQWDSVERTFDSNGIPVLDETACNVSDVVLNSDAPTAACLSPLALWSNSTSNHTFGGNGTQFISGSYFIPNAHVVLSGSGTATFTGAQFFGRTMVAAGNGFVELSPNPATNVPPPKINFGLIR